MCAEDAPDQSSAVEKAAGRTTRIVINSRTQLMSDRSNQMVLLCLKRRFSHSLKATRVGLSDLFSGNLLICSAKALFRIIFGLESRQEVVFCGPNACSFSALRVGHKAFYGDTEEKYSTASVQVRSQMSPSQSQMWLPQF